MSQIEGEEEEKEREREKRVRKRGNKIYEMKAITLNEETGEG